MSVTILKLIRLLTRGQWSSDRRELRRFEKNLRWVGMSVWQVQVIIIFWRVRDKVMSYSVVRCEIASLRALFSSLIPY